MKHVFVLALTATVLTVSVRAQEATPTPKPARRFLMFLPGSSTPDPPKAIPVKPVSNVTPIPASRPAAKPANKPAVKPAPKPAPKVAEKPVVKPAEKPAAKPAEKPVADAGDKSAEKLAKPLVERPLIEKPAEKPAAPAADVTPAVVTSTVPPEPAQIVRAFFAQLGKGDIAGAYLNLMKGSKIGERPEEVRTLKAKTKDAIDIFGAIHGYDLVDIKPVGERLMRATYLSLGNELPLRWRFYFYKAEAEWKLIDLRVDDKLTGIFDEAIEDPPRPSENRP